jgi:phospholipase C
LVLALIVSCSSNDTTKTDAGADASDDPYAKYTADWDRPVNRPDDWEAKHNRSICAYKAGALPAETFGKSIPVDKDIPIDTIVVLMMENRSFDSYFSKLPQYLGNMDIQVAADTAFNPDVHGGTTGKHVRQHALRACVFDTNHEWDGSHIEYDDGKMDGFYEMNDDLAKAPMGAPPEVYSGDRALWYYDQTDIPFYYELAKNFGIADHYHCSLLGPTWPNRMFLYSATSFGNTWNTFPNVLDQYPFPDKDMSVMDELTKRHVSWNIYTDTSTPGLGVVYGGAGYFRWEEHKPPVAPMSQFFADASAGKLPQVVLVDPVLGKEAANQNDEHPPADLQVGQKFVYDVVTALMKSPQWKRMVIFLTYDEHGGFYDSVPPPPACEPDNFPLRLDPMQSATINAKFDRLGFRVPFFAISPYTKKGFIAHTVYDHTSITRFIETKFKMPALTARDANAEIPLEFFDFQNPPWLTPPTFTEPVVDKAQLDWCMMTFPPPMK